MLALFCSITRVTDLVGRDWLSFLRVLQKLAARLEDGSLIDHDSHEKQYLFWPNMAPHTFQRQLQAWRADRSRCPSSTGTVSAYLACSVNLWKTDWLNDREGKPHFKSTTLRRLTSSSFKKWRCTDRDVYADLRDTDRYSCVKNKLVSGPEELN